MSLFIKKHRSKAAKIAGIALFTLLMFVNLQITTNPNSYGDIDLFGLKLSLFTPTYAKEADQSYFMEINPYLNCFVCRYPWDPECSYTGSWYCF